MNPVFSILKALAAEEAYTLQTGERPTLLRAHPLTVATLEIALWALVEAAGDSKMPTGIAQFRGMDVLEDPVLPEGEFRVGTPEEFEAEVLARLDVWRIRNNVKRI